jgi:hypothetical protein
VKFGPLCGTQEEAMTSSEALTSSSSSREKKSPYQRAVSSIRSQIVDAIDLLEEAQEPAPTVFHRIYNAALPAISSREAHSKEVFDNLRNELQMAELGLRDLETKLGESRGDGYGRNIRNQYKEVADEDTRGWLATTFERAPSIAPWTFEERFSGISSLSSDEFSRQVTDAEVDKLMEHLGFFEFDVLAFTSHPTVGSRAISIAGGRMEKRRSLIQRMHDSGSFHCDLHSAQEAFSGFLGKLDDLYKPDAIYHGRAHAVDVMSTAMWFMRSQFLSLHCKAIDVFMTLVAAAIHDVGHPGVNNLFLTKTMDPLALRYNDKSVLESMHAALAFETMKDNDSCNWYGLLSDECQKKIRPGLIGMVLATDMALHGTMVQKISETDGADDASPDQSRFKFILETVLHASDISNPTKPHDQMLRWTKLITEEFWAQGDEEHRLNLEISPLCDRASGMASVPKGQIGFINFVVQPYFHGIQMVIPETNLAVEGLQRNKQFWEKAKDEGLSFDQIFENTS